MKLSSLFLAAAVAVAGGTAMAQSRDTTTTRDGATVTDKARSGAKKVGDATKRGARKAADTSKRVASRGAEAVRNTGQAIERRLPPAPQRTESARLGEGQDRPTNDTRAMGAGRSSGDMAGSDGDRRQRMDDAYANWQRQQGTR